MNICIYLLVGGYNITQYVVKGTMTEVEENY